MIWAWEVDGLTSTTKLVLLSLAQHANEDGAHAFPSVATIAAECRLSERSVQGALKALEAEGYITVVRRLRQTSLFTLRMDLHVVAKRGKREERKGAGDSPYPANAAGLEGAGDSPPPRSSCTPTPQQLHPNLSLNQSMNQQHAREEADPASDCAGAFDAVFGIRPAAAPAPGPVRDTEQQPPPPGWKAPHNPTPRHINYPPIPPEPAGDPVRWMPRLSDPEHRWACLAPGEEIDPTSMRGARKQCRGGWRLREIAGMVADAIGWTDPGRYVDWRPLCAWLDDGIDPIDTILPTIRRIVERRGNVEIATLAYFDRAVRDDGPRRRRAG